MLGNILNSHYDLLVVVSGDAGEASRGCLI
jgi:hypothetical protein